MSHRGELPPYEVGIYPRVQFSQAELQFEMRGTSMFWAVMFYAHYCWVIDCQKIENRATNATLEAVSTSSLRHIDLEHAIHTARNIQVQELEIATLNRDARIENAHITNVDWRIAPVLLASGGFCRSFPRTVSDLLEYSDREMDRLLSIYGLETTDRWVRTKRKKFCGFIGIIYERFTYV